MRLLLQPGIALFLGLLTTNPTAGQDVLDKISHEICPCVGDLNAQTPRDTLTIKLGVCMITGALPYQKELKKKYGVDLERFDGPTGERLGQLVATKLVVNCPGFAELAMRLAQEEDVPPAPTSPSVRTVQGTVQEVTPSQFLTVTVRTDHGPTYEFLLLDHVPNIEQVSQEPGKAKGFRAKWDYEEREFYDPYTRTYKTYRVLRSITP